LKPVVIISIFFTFSLFSVYSQEGSVPLGQQLSERDNLSGRYHNITAGRDPYSLWFLLGGDGDKQSDEVGILIQGNKLSARLYRQDALLASLEQRIELTEIGIRLPKVTRWFWEFLLLWGSRDYSLNLKWENFKLKVQMVLRNTTMLIIFPFSGGSEAVLEYSRTSRSP
jgi:hypothetical protein